MNKSHHIAELPANLMAEMQAAVERAAKGIREPEAMRRACADMDQLREQIRKREGILDFGVPAVRELRDT
jgi:succinate dehydrogenase/fumarate reductase flavoprotein subunit